MLTHFFPVLMSLTFSTISPLGPWLLLSGAFLYLAFSTLNYQLCLSYPLSESFFLHFNSYFSYLVFLLGLVLFGCFFYITIIFSIFERYLLCLVYILGPSVPIIMFLIHLLSQGSASGPLCFLSTVFLWWSHTV